MTDTNDKQLLELAAKAAGINVLTPPPNAAKLDGLYCWINKTRKPWNPLHDDGDALRLAVRLNFDILQYPVSSRSNFVEVIANLDNTEPQPWAFEVRAPDPYAATRRAITVAAAAIGRDMV